MFSILLLSGGLDSLVLLARECRAGRDPYCLSFDYGQKHRRELDAARAIAGVYHVRHRFVMLPSGIFADSALTGELSVPKGLHFEDPGQAATVVPNRNLVLLSIAASYAAGIWADRVLFAAHAGDAAVYPDCRREFVEAADRVMRLACGVGVEAPFLGMTKWEIAELGRSLDVPFDLAWSCYEGGEVACGQCGACLEREGAMHE